MKRIDTQLEGVCVLEPRVFGDDRGFFLEAYNQQTFESLGIPQPFVQDNHSRSVGNVLRGLHFQIEHAQAKLVRVIAGAIFDVAVDVRPGSSTFGRWVGHELSAQNKKMLFIPEGYAHGFYVLGEGAEVIYKCTDFYAAEHERGVIYNDPDIAIAWPIPPGLEPVLSTKDAAYGPLSALSADDLPKGTSHE